MRIISLCIIVLALHNTCFSKISHAKKKKVLICGVCKDIAPFLDNMIQNIETLGRQFADYQVVIYENNSKDQTVSLLSKWQKRNPRVKFISETYSLEALNAKTIAHTWDNLPCRIELIAQARNKLLEEIYKSTYDDCTYVIMADLDFKSRWNMKGILSSFEHTSRWDVICANGVNGDGGGVTYDYYALRSHEFPLGPELLGNLYWDSALLCKLKYKRKKYIPVQSAFGGLAIYKREFMKGIYYDAYPDEFLTHYYEKVLNDPTLQDHSHLVNFHKVHGETHLVQYINNCGYEEPVCCEHVVFHSRLIGQRGARIFINPQMVIEY
ncbi:MAG: hypothetical protein S4CHLAM102_06450 [Chlamydiia bacterium]|nr:hypothetical protein [Chlamydiia bacterium]